MGSLCSSEEVIEPTLPLDQNPSRGVTDLDQMVKTWAISVAPRLGIKNAKKAKVEVVWNRVTFTPGQPNWEPIRGLPEPPNITVYTSSFCNNTHENAEHTLKVERTSSATSKTSISKGYSANFNLGLSLNLPHDVAEATASYGRSVKVDRAEETTREHVQSWSVDTVIPSPPSVRTMATVKVKEQRWSGKFTLPVTIKGMVVVNFYDQNTPGTFLGSVEEDVCNLLPRFGAEAKDSKTVTWTLNGTCDFEFGVEQVTEVKHEAL